MGLCRSRHDLYPSGFAAILRQRKVLRTRECVRRRWHGLIPLNSPRYCGDREVCGFGTMCTKDKKCLSVTDERACPNGRSYCEDGQACLKNGKCLSAASLRYCGNGNSCKPGSICALDGKGCRPEDSTDCGDGNYCLAGEMCTNDIANKCLSLSSVQVCSNRSYCAKGTICTSELTCLTSASLSEKLDELQRTFDGLRDILQRLNAVRSMTRSEREDWSKSAAEASTDGWGQAFNLLTSGYVLNKLSKTAEDALDVEDQLSDANSAIGSAIDRLSGTTDRIVASSCKRQSNYYTGRGASSILPANDRDFERKESRRLRLGRRSAA